MAYLKQKARLQEAHRRGEAQLHDSVQQLGSGLLPYPITGEQGLGISQHCRSAGAQVPVICCIRLLCLLLTIIVFITV